MHRRASGQIVSYWVRVARVALETRQLNLQVPHLARMRGLRLAAGRLISNLIGFGRMDAKMAFCSVLQTSFVTLIISTTAITWRCVSSWHTHKHMCIKR